MPSWSSTLLHAASSIALLCAIHPFPFPLFSSARCTSADPTLRLRAMRTLQRRLHVRHRDAQWASAATLGTYAGAERDAALGAARRSGERTLHGIRRRSVPPCTAL
jgi:hypothetical protein